MNWLSAQQVAKILGINESTVRINAGKGKFGFSSVRVGSLWKFPEDEVMEFRYGKNWKEILKSQENENTTNA